MGTLWVRYILPLIRPLLSTGSGRPVGQLRGASVGQERLRELAEACCRSGWGLSLLPFPDYWSFNREKGNSRICFQVKHNGVITIKFATPEDVVSKQLGSWELVGSGCEGPTNYYVTMDSANPLSSVRDLMPLLEQAWAGLQQVP